MTETARLRARSCAILVVVVAAGCEPPHLARWEPASCTRPLALSPTELGVASLSLDATDRVGRGLLGPAHVAPGEPCAMPEDARDLVVRYVVPPGAAQVGVSFEAPGARLAVLDACPPSHASARCGDETLLVAAEPGEALVLVVVPAEASVVTLTARSQPIAAPSLLEATLEVQGTRATLSAVGSDADLDLALARALFTDVTGAEVPESEGVVTFATAATGPDGPSSVELASPPRTATHAWVWLEDAWGLRSGRVRANVRHLAE